MTSWQLCRCELSRRALQTCRAFRASRSTSRRRTRPCATTKRDSTSPKSRRLRATHDITAKGVRTMGNTPPRARLQRFLHRPLLRSVLQTLPNPCHATSLPRQRLSRQKSTRPRRRHSKRSHAKPQRLRRHLMLWGQQKAEYPQPLCRRVTPPNPQQSELLRQPLRPREQRRPTQGRERIPRPRLPRQPPSRWSRPRQDRLRVTTMVVQRPRRTSPKWRPTWRTTWVTPGRTSRPWCATFATGSSSACSSRCPSSCTRRWAASSSRRHRRSA